MTDKDRLKQVFGASLRAEQDKIQRMLDTAPADVPQDVLDLLKQRQAQNQDTLDRFEDEGRSK